MSDLISAWRVLLLAVSQGLAEIFPISSSGHLVVLSRLLQTPLTFNLAVFFHIGTFLAILVKYRAQVWQLVSGRAGWRLPAYMALSFSATALVGLGVKPLADHIVAEQADAVTLLWIANGSGLMAIGWLAPLGKRKINELRLGEFLLIGLVQGLTAIPGISRLGMTLGIGLLLGLAWFDALDLSFLLSLPTIFFANAFTLLQEAGRLPWLPLLAPEGTTAPAAGSGFLFNDAAVLGAVFLLTFVTGLASMRILYRYLSRKLLVFFGLYCLFAGIFFYYFLRLF